MGRWDEKDETRTGNKDDCLALACCRIDDCGSKARSISSPFLWIWMGLGVRSAKTISDSVSVTNELAQAQLNPAYRKKAGTRVAESWL